METPVVSIHPCDYSDDDIYDNKIVGSFLFYVIEIGSNTDSKKKNHKNTHLTYLELVIAYVLI